MYAKFARKSQSHRYLKFVIQFLTHERKDMHTVGGLLFFHRRSFHSVVYVSRSDCIPETFQQHVNLSVVLFYHQCKALPTKAISYVAAQAIIFIVALTSDGSRHRYGKFEKLH